MKLEVIEEQCAGCARVERQRHVVQVAKDKEYVTGAKWNWKWCTGAKWNWKWCTGSKSCENVIGGMKITANQGHYNRSGEVKDPWQN